MKTIAEVKALQRELEQRLKMLSQDVVFNRNETVASPYLLNCSMEALF